MNKFEDRANVKVRSKSFCIMPFSKKVVLITGASSGIGAVTAIHFAKNNATLALVGRNEKKLELVAKQCREQSNTEVLMVKGDISMDQDVERIVNEIVENFERIDILINCAGMSKFGGIKDGIEVYDQVTAVNVRGTFLITSKVVPYIIKSRGNIVNVSSILAQKCLKEINMLAYSMSKAALDQFTKCLALELGKDGVRVNSVSPGATKTPFFETLGIQKDDVEHVLSNIPTVLGKVIESNEVADLILFLAGEHARSITGSLYVIDNGELLV